MADQVLVFNQKVSFADEIETLYTAPNFSSGVKIRAFTSSNDTDSSAWYKAYIFNQAGQIDSAIIPQTIVVRDKADYGAPSVGHVIPAGGTLRVESSKAEGLNFYVTGQVL